jgi:hypothetical protein
VSVRFVYYLALGEVSRVNAFIKRMKTRGLISPWFLAAIGLVAILAILNRAVAEEEANTNAPVLHTRTFKIEGDPNKFYSELLRVNNISEKNRIQLPGRSAADLQSAFTGFFNAIGVNLAPPKSFFIGDRKGTLTVRATDEDLELIELAIHAFTNYSPEVQITVQCYELGDEAFSSFQLEWLSKLSASKEGAGWVGGVLTETGFRKVLKTIDAKNSGDLLNKGEVTTLSGRQANFSLREANGDTKTNSGPSINYYWDDIDQPLELDAVPHVDKDGYTIQSSLIATATETNRYDGLNNPVVPSTNTRARVHQLVTSCVVWDGQTAVLLLKPPYAQREKILVIFVTFVVIGPDGNRKNPAESLPFAQKAVPRQTPY